MIVGVPREIKKDEYRVALLPVGAEELVARGHQVLVEAGVARAVEDLRRVALIVGFGLVGRHFHHRLMLVRVKRHADRCNACDAVLVEDFLQFALGRFDAFEA